MHRSRAATGKFPWDGDFAFSCGARPRGQVDGEIQTFICHDSKCSEFVCSAQNAGVSAVRCCPATVRTIASRDRPPLSQYRHGACSQPPCSHRSAGPAETVPCQAMKSHRLLSAVHDVAIKTDRLSAVRALIETTTQRSLASWLTTLISQSAKLLSDDFFSLLACIINVVSKEVTFGSRIIVTE